MNMCKESGTNYLVIYSRIRDFLRDRQSLLSRYNFKHMCQNNALSCQKMTQKLPYIVKRSVALQFREIR